MGRHLTRPLDHDSVVHTAPTRSSCDDRAADATTSGLRQHLTWPDDVQGALCRRLNVQRDEELVVEHDRIAPALQELVREPGFHAGPAVPNGFGLKRCHRATMRVVL